VLRHHKSFLLISRL